MTDSETSIIDLEAPVFNPRTFDLYISEMVLAVGDAEFQKK